MRKTAWLLVALVSSCGSPPPPPRPTPPPQASVAPSAPPAPVVCDAPGSAVDQARAFERDGRLFKALAALGVTAPECAAAADRERAQITADLAADPSGFPDAKVESAVSFAQGGMTPQLRRELARARFQIEHAVGAKHELITIDSTSLQRSPGGRFMDVGGTLVDERTGRELSAAFDEVTYHAFDERRVVFVGRPTADVWSWTIIDVERRTVQASGTSTIAPSRAACCDALLVASPAGVELVGIDVGWRKVLGEGKDIEIDVFEIKIPSTFLWVTRGAAHATLHVHDRAREKTTDVALPAGHVTRVAFSASAIAIATDTGHLRVYGLAGNERLAAEEPHVDALAVSDDGSTLAWSVDDVVHTADVGGARHTLAPKKNSCGTVQQVVFKTKTLVEGAHVWGDYGCTMAYDLTAGTTRVVATIPEGSAESDAKYRRESDRAAGRSIALCEKLGGLCGSWSISGPGKEVAYPTPTGFVIADAATKTAVRRYLQTTTGCSKVLWFDKATIACVDEAGHGLFVSRASSAVTWRAPVGQRCRIGHFLYAAQLCED